MTHLSASLWCFGLVAAAALAALVLDMTGKRGWAHLLPSGLLLASGAGALYAAWTLSPGADLGGFYVGGARSAVFGIAAVTAAFTTLVADRDRAPGQFAGLVSLAVLGAGLASASGDLVSMLVGIETAAVCSYALVSRPHTSRSAEAAMKYFVQGAVATGFFVLGLAVFTGLFAPDAAVQSIATAASLKSDYPLAIAVAALALLVALAFKVGAAPLHSWAPDAYEAADAPGSAYMAGSLKVALFGVLAAVVTPIVAVQVGADGSVGELVYQLLGVVGASAALSIVVGSTVALRTDSYRRMLGYAGVAQVGYALIALAALNPSGALFFVATYAVGTTAAFLGAEAFERFDPSWDGTVTGLAGAGRRHPVAAASVTVALMSLAGLPPLLGFWGKFQAFGSAVRGAAVFLAQGESLYGSWLIVLTTVGVLGSVVSLAYYGAVVRSLFFDSGREPVSSSPGDETVIGTRVLVSALVVLATAILLAGVLPLLVGVAPLVRGFLPG